MTRKKAKEEIINAAALVSERRFKALIENSKDVIALTDTERLITYISPAVKDVLGYEPEELIGKTSYSVLMNPDEVNENVAFRMSIAPGQTVSRQTRVRHKDGSWRWLEAEVTNYLEDPAIRGMLTNFRDVTAKKTAEEAVLNSENKFRALIENGKDGIALTGPDRLFTYLGPQVKNILGYEPEELIGTHPLALYHPDDHAKIFSFVEGIKDKDPHTIEDLRILCKDGSWKWAELTFCDQLDDPAVNALVCNFRDVTDRKNAEDKLEQLNQSLEKKVEDRTAQLQESNKALESFSYMAAHDLQSPLRILSGYATILKNEYQGNLGEDGSDLLDTIVLKTRQMSKLISDMLTFSRASHVTMKEENVDMDSMVADITDHLRLSAANPAAANIIIHTLGSRPCDAGLMHQVWVNLISNALKYSGKKEKPEIEIGTKKAPGETIYYVRDNGAGFDMQNAVNLFEVFKRLHGPAEFEGTGIGLALVKSIIIRHRGRVWAEAEVNKGATFYFALPD